MEKYIETYEIRKNQLDSILKQIKYDKNRKADKSVLEHNKVSLFSMLYEFRDLIIEVLEEYLYSSNFKYKIKLWFFMKRISFKMRLIEVYYLIH